MLMRQQPCLGQFPGSVFLSWGERLVSYWVGLVTLTFYKYKVVTSAPKEQESRTKSNTINLDGTSW